MKKLAIIISHPIQYYAPVFKLLALECNLMVFYTLGKQSQKEIFDEGFKKKIAWDLPLLESYNFTFIGNTAIKPGNHFNGIRNPTLIAEIKAFNPDVILVYGWAYQSHLSLIRYFSGKIPVWFRGDSTLSAKQHWVKKVILTWIYKHIDLAFYVGTRNKKYFKEYGLKENQLKFAPHAVDNNRFGENRLLEALEIRHVLGIDNSDLLILFAGKFEQKKDPMLLLNAFIKLNMANTHLLFVGNGELEDNLKSKALSLQFKNIHFMDFQNQTQMPVIYQACDLFCLPSKGPGETWGLAVNEAMAAGKAILISDQVGCSEDLIMTNYNGLIFNANDLEDLQLKLSQILNKSLLKKLGRESKDLICDWSIEHQVNILARTLND